MDEKKLDELTEKMLTQPKVVEVDGDVMQAKDKYYLTDAYRDILYMAGAMERIAKVAREDADDEV